MSAVMSVSKAWLDQFEAEAKAEALRAAAEEIRVWRNRGAISLDSESADFVRSYLTGCADEIIKRNIEGCPS